MQKKTITKKNHMMLIQTIKIICSRYFGARINSDGNSQNIALLNISNKKFVVYPPIESKVFFLFGGIQIHLRLLFLSSSFRENIFFTK